MKRLATIATLLVLTVSAFAQGSKLPVTLDIAEAETNGVRIEVFNMPSDGVNNYFLNVGTLGIGDDFVQINIDPVSKLYILLGNNLDDALAVLNEIKGLFDCEPDTSIELTGSLSITFPKDDNIEPVRVTYRKLLLSKMIEFSLNRESLIRATHIPKSDFNSIVTGVKFYRKLHPRE